MAEETGAKVEKGKDEISVFSGKTKRSATFVNNFGDNLEASRQLYSDEIIHSIFLSACVIKAQACCRTVLNNDEKSVDDAIAAGAGFVPGVVAVRKGAKKDKLQQLIDDAKGGKEGAKEALVAAIEELKAARASLK